MSQNILKLILKTPRFVSFGANVTKFGGNPDPRGVDLGDLDFPLGGSEGEIKGWGSRVFDCYLEMKTTQTPLSNIVKMSMFLNMHL